MEQEKRIETVGERAAREPRRGRILHTLFPELAGRAAGRGSELLLDAVAFGLALLFARTHFIFGMYPFALAYLAAVRRRVLPIFFGALLGSWMLDGVGGIFSLACLFLLGLRVLASYPAPRRVILPVTDRLFGEGVLPRVASAALSGAALAGYELAVSGPVPYSLWFAAVAIPTPALLALLFVWCFESGVTVPALLGRADGGTEGLFGRVRPALAELSLLSLLLSVGYALLPLSFFGLSLSSLFSSAVILFAARRFGAARAGVLGLALGLLGGVTLAPAYAILGLAAGFLFTYGIVYGLLGALVGASAFAGYVEGASGFLSVAPEGAIAVLFLLPTISHTAAAHDPAARELARHRTAEVTRAAAMPPTPEHERLARLGGAFSELSGMFYRLSDAERRPHAAEYFVECQKVCARYCATCSNRVRCWEQGERIAERAVFGLATRLREEGKITSELLPPELKSGCPRIEEILDEIRDECAAMAVKRYRGDRNEFLSFDYAMLAKLLADAAAADREESTEDGEGCRRLSAALGEESGELALAVFGTRRKRVAVGAESAPLLERSATRLHELCEGTLGCALSPPLLSASDGTATLTMRGIRRFAVASASSSVPVAGSGDRLRLFETEDDFFYAVLSDGMGSGEEAAATAEVSVEFLETMLKAGTSRRTALRMLNNLVRTRRTECSATVDMLVLDLLYGHAAFLKSGAAPSYIKRGGEVLRVRSRSMPLGLRKNPDAERIHVELYPGDVVVMLSDGIVSEDDDPAWLLSLLSEEQDGELPTLAERIVAEAVSRIPEPRDDITVALVRPELI